MKFTLCLISICLYISYTSANSVQSSWKSVTTVVELDEYIKEAGKKLIVLEFWGSHCGPCKTVAPILEQLAQKYPSVIMIKVDVIESPLLADKFHISTIPSFVFLEDGDPIEQQTGFLKRKFEDVIHVHSSQEQSS